jgi:phosphatidylinositol glycan class M
MLIGWIVTQGWWLFNGWRLEFKGVADIFVSGLFASASLFFVWNIYMIGEFIGDVSTQIAAEGERHSVHKDK